MSTGTQSQFREVAREIPPETRADLLRQIRPRIVEKYQKEIPHPTQQLFMLQQGREAMYGGAAGGGKASRLYTGSEPWYDPSMETKVLTPKGFMLWSKVAVGDIVCNPDGTTATVKALHYPKNQQFYRVTFADGASVEVGHDHLWGARNRRNRKRRKVALGQVPARLTTSEDWNYRYFQRYTVMTTIEMRDLLLDGESLAVPLTSPVAFTRPAGRWPILPPYTVGVLIGDGSLTQEVVRWNKPDTVIADYIEQEVAPLGLVVTDYADGSNHGIVGGRDTTSAQKLLERVGLFGKRSWEKFIPEQYKYLPVDKRFSLVQGLMDTDGYVDDRGHVEYSTTSEQLAKDVQWLLRSLGYTATITNKATPTYTYKGEKKTGRPAYRVYVRGNDMDRLFRLPRKRNRCVERVGVGSGDTSGDLWVDNPVVSIEPTAVADGKCITVDNPNGLYITDDFIVTHNSSALLSAALQYVDVPGYSALLLRRTWPDLSLPGAIMDRAKTWLMDTDAQSREGGRRWIFPSGAQLVFGYLSRDNDKYRYASAEFQFCVAPSTLIRMGDGSLTPIRDIVAGDSVMTLQGPRKVLKTHDVGIKPAVNLLTARGPATVSTHHPVLTPDGWLTPAELMTATGEYHFTAIVGGHIGSGVPAYQFPHPYTGLPRTINTTAQQHKVKIMLTSPERMLDLTVEDGSHYVLWNGIVAKNCGFDELTQFPQSTYEYLFSRLRRPALVCVRCQNAVRRSTTDRTYWEHAAPSNCRECKPDPKMLYKYGEAPDGMTLFDVPLRMRSATNPASNWVRDRFVDPQTRRPGALFIPSTLTDNPSLDQETYRESLSHLSPVDRERLLNGDWDVEEEGEYFQRNWFNVLRERPTDPRIRWCRYWDLAATSDGDWSAGCLIGLTPDGQWVIADMQRTQSTPREVERLVYQTAVQDGFGVPVWMEQEPGSSGVTVIDHYRRNVLVGYEFRADKKTGSKELRAKPLSAAVEAGNVSIVVGLWNRAFLDEMALYPRGINDDQCDSATGGFHVLSTTRRSRILA